MRLGFPTIGDSPDCGDRGTQCGRLFLVCAICMHAPICVCMHVQMYSMFLALGALLSAADKFLCLLLSIRPEAYRQGIQSPAPKRLSRLGKYVYLIQSILHSCTLSASG